MSENIPRVDPRQQRTRERLHAAVLALAEQRPIAEVSVVEVAAAAGVHRSTFYEHATSPFDLLEQALRAELDTLRAGLAGLVGLGEDEVGPAVDAVTRAVLEHVLRHRAIYRRGLGEGSGAAGLHPMLSRHFRESGLVLLGRTGTPVRVAGVPAARVLDAASRLLADGTVGQIVGWLEETDPDVEEFLRVYRALLPSWWPGVREQQDGQGSSTSHPQPL